MPNMTFKNWTSGLWTAGPSSKAPRGTLTRMKNVLVMDEGTVAFRPGADTFVSLADTVDGDYAAATHFYKDSTSTVYDAAGASLGFTQPGKRLRMAGMPAYGVNNDIVFFPDCMKKVYAGVASNWGIQDMPLQPLVADGGAVGQLTGTYTYIFAFYNDTTLTLSTVSQSSAGITVAGRQVTVSNIPLVCADPQATHVAIYRTYGTVSGQWYLVTRIAIGTTATYQDNIPDTALGETIDPLIQPPTGCYVAGRFNNRMLLLAPVTNSRYVYVSQPSKPEMFTLTLYELMTDAGDTAEGVVQVGSYAYVFGQNKVYQFSIDASNLIYVSTMSNVPGTVNGRTIASGAFGIYYQGEDGIYLLRGFSSLESPYATKVSENIDSLFRGTDRGSLSLISDTDNCSGCYVGGRYYLTYSGEDSEWHTIVYNETKKRWKHYTGWLWCAPPLHGPYPIMGLDSVVGLHVTDTYTDAGETYAAELGFTLGLPSTVLYHLRGFRMSCESVGDITVSIYDDNTLLYSITLSTQDYTDGFDKHSFPLDTYATQPEVRVSSNDYFVLRSFEINVNPVRKVLTDYTTQGIQGSQGQSQE